MTLFEAVERGDVAEVKALLGGKPDANVREVDQRTPLIAAAAQGSLELVELLLEAGAYPDLKDSMGETALLKAAANGHLEVARALGPFAEAEERAMASAFLNAAGRTHGPDELKQGGGLKRKAAELAARAAQFVGHDEPAERLARIDRADGQAKKK